ncbi:MAG: glycosyltransferase, partial [bacterium]
MTAPAARPGRRRLLYLTYAGNPVDGATSGIETGQVRELLKELASDFEIEWLALVHESVPDPGALGAYRESLAAKAVGFELVVLPAGRVRRYVSAWRLVRRKLRAFGPEVVHARRLVAAALALLNRQRRQRVIFDARGIASAEALGAPGRHIHRRVLAAAGMWMLEVVAAGFSAATVTVSLEMRRHFARLTRRPVVTIPNSAASYFRFDPALRAAVRRELGYGNGQAVLAYAGGLASWWQSPEGIARSFRAFRSTVPDARLLVLTPHSPTLVHRHQSDDERQATAFRHVPHEQVPGCFCASDVGLLVLNTASKANCQASAVKFAEYLACGLPVFTLSAVTQAAGVIRQSGAGAIGEQPEDIAGCAQRLLSPDTRAAALKTGDGLGIARAAA